MILADLQIDGQARKVLMQAPKNGFFYVLDRTNGRLISARPYTQVTWASGVDPPAGARSRTLQRTIERRAECVRPGPRGAHSWQPMSFNPRTGLVYIPVDETAHYFVPVPTSQHPPGGFNIGAMEGALPDDLLNQDWPTGGRLVAWDPRTQQEQWGVPYVGQWNGGTLTTAGNLVFQGTANANLMAYRANDGVKVWEAPVISGVGGAADQLPSQRNTIHLGNDRLGRRLHPLRPQSRAHLCLRARSAALAAARAEGAPDCTGPSDRRPGRHRARREVVPRALRTLSQRRHHRHRSALLRAWDLRHLPGDRPQGCLRTAGYAPLRARPDGERCPGHPLVCDRRACASFRGSARRTRHTPHPIDHRFRTLNFSCPTRTRAPWDLGTF